MKRLKRDYRKLMDQKAREKRRSRKYIYVGTSVATGLLLGLTPISIATPFFSTQSTQAYAALIDGQLFSSLNSSNSVEQLIRVLLLLKMLLEVWISPFQLIAVLI